MHFQTVPKYFDLYIDSSDPVAGIREIFNSWSDEQIEVDVQVPDQGKINTTFLVKISGNLSALWKMEEGKSAENATTCVIRIFGENSEVLIDRDQERMTMMFIHANRVGMPLLAAFKNGNVFGFAPGQRLNLKTIREPQISDLVACKLAHLHSVPLPIDSVSSGSTFFTKLYAMVELLQALNMEQMDERYAEIREMDLASGVEFFQKIAEGYNEQLVLCHNDLSDHNIILSPDGNVVDLIDWEFCGPNYAVLDLADYFASITAKDPSNPLTRDEINRFLTKYLAERQRQALDVPCDVDDDVIIGDDVVDMWYNRIQTMMPMGLLYWGLWNVLQPSFTKVEFDFLSWGLFKLRTYMKLKAEIAQKLAVFN